MLPMRTILHPTDFSEPAGEAFGLACALARDHGARLLVLHVGPAPVLPYVPGMVPLDLTTWVLHARQKLARLHPPGPGVELDGRLVLGTSVAAEIVRAAGAEGCDLIVMGTHGRSGLRRALLGSVAEEVLRKAPCPVLTIRPPLPATAAHGGSPGAVSTPSRRASAQA
jgi:nucleotide-binding universal stress UspA family protein